MFRRIPDLRNERVAAACLIRHRAAELGGGCTGQCILSGSLGYDSTMYNAQVLDHFRNPRNAGRIANASAQVQASNPVCGDILELAARVEDGRIAEARFLCRGCTTAIACASWLTERLTGSSVAVARGVTAEEISAALGGLPEATFHGAQLAAEALGMLMKRVPSGG